MKTPIDVELMKRIFNSKPSKINGKQLQFQQCERRKQSLNQNDTNRKVIFTQTFFACLYFKRICGSRTLSISINLIIFSMLVSTEWDNWTIMAYSVQISLKSSENRFKAPNRVHGGHYL